MKSFFLFSLLLFVFFYSHAQQPPTSKADSLEQANQALLAAERQESIKALILPNGPLA